MLRRQNPLTNVLDGLCLLCVDHLPRVHWAEDRADTLRWHSSVQGESLWGLPFTHDGLGVHPMGRWQYIECSLTRLASQHGAGCSTVLSYLSFASNLWHSTPVCSIVPPKHWGPHDCTPAIVYHHILCWEHITYCTWDIDLQDPLVSFLLATHPGGSLRYEQWLQII